MKHDEAYTISLKLLGELKPHCFRCEIAGSVRREKPEVKDIEIVAIPKPYDTGLFESGIAIVINRFEKVKGELQYGKCKYTQRILPEGIKLDLFIADENNWGLIFAIRTGSPEYSHRVLATGWCKKGYNSVDGMLKKDDKLYAMKEEKDVFDLIGISFVEPKFRNI